MRRFAHHRAAVNDLARLSGKPAGRFDQIADRRTDRYDQIFRLSNCGAIHRDAFVHQRHAVLHELRHLGQRGDVDDNHAQRRKPLSLRDDLARRIEQQHLLCALRVNALKRLDLDSGIVRKHAVHFRDRVGLVGFDADNKLLCLYVFLQQRNAFDNQVAVLHHRAVVAGDVRLALRAVDQNRLDRRAADCIQLRPQRKCCSAESNDPAAADSRQKFVQIMDFRRSEIRIFFHLSIACNADGKHRFSAILHKGLDRRHRPGYGRMNRRGIFPFLPGNELTHTYRVANGDHRNGRLPRMHGHREQNFLWGRNTNRVHTCRVFMMGYLECRNVFSEAHQTPASSIFITEYPANHSSMMQSAKPGV